MLVLSLILKTWRSGDAIARQIIEDNSSILELSGFDPAFYHDPQFIALKDKVPPFKLDDQSIIFGHYNYVDEHDYTNLMKADQTGDIITIKSKIHDHKVMKSFIPMSGASKSVIVVNFDYNAISTPLFHQLLIQALISLGLIIVTVLCQLIYCRIYDSNTSAHSQYGEWNFSG